MWCTAVLLLVIQRYKADIIYNGLPSVVQDVEENELHTWQWDSGYARFRLTSSNKRARDPVGCS